MEMQKWIEFSLLLLLLLTVCLLIRRPLKRREMFRLAASRFKKKNRQNAHQAAHRSEAHRG
jgi:hypothetical protein